MSSGMGRTCHGNAAPFVFPPLSSLSSSTLFTLFTFDRRVQRWSLHERKKKTDQEKKLTDIFIEPAKRRGCCISRSWADSNVGEGKFLLRAGSLKCLREEGMKERRSKWNSTWRNIRGYQELNCSGDAVVVRPGENHPRCTNRQDTKPLRPIYLDFTTLRMGIRFHTNRETAWNTNLSLSLSLSLSLVIELRTLARLILRSWETNRAT